MRARVVAMRVVTNEETTTDPYDTLDAGPLRVTSPPQDRFVGMRPTSRTLAALALVGAALSAAGTAHAHGVLSAPAASAPVASAPASAVAPAGVADDLLDEIGLDEVEGLDLLQEN
ncbi:hypothetical protein ACIRO3_26360 [Streptomyces sp. NPDC102278]|uniref:hypothetical protein n=1 Tax=Streptomyces sp. NPDC102278 TaxID=3366152 RepID=UPI00381ABD53